MECFTKAYTHSSSVTSMSNNITGIHRRSTCHEDANQIIFNMTNFRSIRDASNENKRKHENGKSTAHSVPNCLDTEPPPSGSNTKIAKFDGNNTHCYSDTVTY